MDTARRELEALHILHTLEENRRLKAVNTELLEALEALYAAYYSEMSSEYDFPGNPWTPIRGRRANGESPDTVALNAAIVIARARGQS